MEKPGTAVTISTVLGKIASVIGYTFGTVALITIIVGAFDMGSEAAIFAMIISAIILVVCILLILKGRQIKKRIKRFNKYVSIISMKQIISLEYISERTSQSVDFVRDDLQKMIAKRFFVNAHINIITDELVIDRRGTADFGQESRTQQAAQANIEAKENDSSGSGASDTEPEGKPENSEYIEYDVMKEDLIGAYEHDLKKPLLTRFLLYYLTFQFVIMIYGGALMILYFVNASAPLLLFSIFALPVAGVLIGIRFTRQRRAARILEGKLRRGEVEQQYFGRHRLELKEDGTELRYGTICVRRQYAGILKIVEYAGGIMIFCSQLDRDIIPSSAFKDTQQRGAFLNNLQSKIAQAKNVGISAQSVEEHKQGTCYELEYAWDEASFITAMARANRMMYTTRLGWTAVQIIVTVIGLILCFVGIISIIWEIAEMSEFYRQGLSLLPGALCCGAGLGFLSSLLTAFTPLGKKLYRQQIDNGVIPRDYFSPQSLCFKEDRITELRRLSSFDVMYDKVYCVRHDADGMYLLLKGKRAFVIPNSAFTCKERKLEIVNYIKKKTE